MTNCTDVPPPNSLKEALDFAGALSENSGDLKNLVGQELEDRVTSKLNFHTKPKTVSEEEDSIKSNYDKVLYDLNDLRTSIVGLSHQTSYGSYRPLKESYGEDCVDLCVERMLAILPRLHVTLSFMKFKVDSLQKSLGGGVWENQQCDGGGSSGSGTSLSQWLKSDSHSPGLPSASEASSSRSSPTLLPGGYGSELSDNPGGSLDTPLGELLSGSGPDDGGSLHNLLLDVAIVTPWSPCNTATCVAVVRGLCDKSNDTFKKEMLRYPDLALAFKSVSSYITTLAPDNDTAKSSALLTALFTGAPFKYSQILETKAFQSYMSWLKDNLDSLIASLVTLGTETTSWSKDGLQRATISGPFGYGFSFSDQWKGWNNGLQTQISTSITKLTDELNELQQSLKQSFIISDPNASSGSAGSIAGGLIGTAAVGGAGAAVAFNVGGVTTALKGAFGCFK
ncbi:secreted antigen 1 [Babesia caballi]|uniref:Secreted antigen 1 n=1 Tax=Babesia caballi TaxID=5871 RepID=A0AAV4LVH7_BABCB|nr:secreted antigen 1 [Babesia caballi]